MTFEKYSLLPPSPNDVLRLLTVLEDDAFEILKAFKPNFGQLGQEFAIDLRGTYSKKDRKQDGGNKTCDHPSRKSHSVVERFALSQPKEFYGLIDPKSRDHPIEQTKPYSGMLPE